MSKRIGELYELAYAAQHEAADLLSNAAAPSTTHKWAVNPAGVRKALAKAQEALCKLRALESVLAGNPEPKRGD